MLNLSDLHNAILYHIHAMFGNVLGNYTVYLFRNIGKRLNGQNIPKNKSIIWVFHLTSKWNIYFLYLFSYIETTDFKKIKWVIHNKDFFQDGKLKIEFMNFSERYFTFLVYMWFSYLQQKDLGHLLLWLPES